MSSSPASVRVRPLAASDLDVYAHMVVAYFAEDPGGLPMSWERARRQGSWILACAESTERPAGLPRAWAQRVSAWIVEVDGVVSGYLLLVPYFSNEFGGPIVYLDELYVDGAVRGRGVGGAVLGWLQAWAEEEGLMRLELEVHHGNEGAKRLYLRHGFHVEERSLLGFQVRVPDLGVAGA